MPSRSTAVIAIAALLPLCPAAAIGQTCPAPLGTAHRLALVIADGLQTSTARLRLFRRDSPGEPWRPVGTPWPARIGNAGMAWGYRFRGLARAGEPVKLEGDRRTPAGVYRIGRSFGFAASPRPGYLRLRPQTLCVNDVTSPAYNSITTRAAVGPHVRGEMMRAVSHYRWGLLVDYPSNAAARAGSCIFIHVWRSPANGTSGCVALSAQRVEALQDFAAAGAVIAILPEQALGRLSACLPGAAVIGHVN